MSSPPADGGLSTEGPFRAYRLVSATFQSREYPEGVLRVNEAGSEIELTQWAGKKKKRAETVIARFRLQPNAEVTVDGSLLRVSELSVTLESSGVAGEVAEVLRRPAKELEGLVGRAEASASLFLDSREEALNLLSRIMVDPRKARFDVDSTAPADSEPLDAAYSAHSTRLAEALDAMKSSLAGGEKGLRSGATERLYAITYTIGAVQDALFEGGSDLAQEVAALQELGIATTAQDLRTEKPSSRLLVRAHPLLFSLAVSATLSSSPTLGA